MKVPRTFSLSDYGKEKRNHRSKTGNQRGRGEGSGEGRGLNTTVKTSGSLSEKPQSRLNPTNLRLYFLPFILLFLPTLLKLGGEMRQTFTRGVALGGAGTCSHASQHVACAAHLPETLAFYRSATRQRHKISFGRGRADTVKDTKTKTAETIHRNEERRLWD